MGQRAGQQLGSLSGARGSPRVEVQELPATGLERAMVGEASCWRLSFTCHRAYNSVGGLSWQEKVPGCPAEGTQENYCLVSERADPAFVY